MAELSGADQILVDQILALTDTAAAQTALQTTLEEGYLVVANDVSGAVGSALGVTFELNDVAQRNVLRAGGLRAGLVDLDQQTRDAIFESLAAGREQGLTADNLARFIAADVEGGPWGSAATRARVIARTEGAHAANVSTLQAARSMPETEHVQIFDNRTGTNDELCVAADTRVVTIEEAEAMGLAHPNCTRSFVPVNSLLMDEMFGTAMQEGQGGRFGTELTSSPRFRGVGPLNPMTKKNRGYWEPSGGWGTVDTTEDALLHIRNHTRGSSAGFEVGASFDRSGRFIGGYTSRNKSIVKIPNKVINQQPGGIQIHNHPSAKSFSKADLHYGINTATDELMVVGRLQGADVTYIAKTSELVGDVSDLTDAQLKVWLKDRSKLAADTYQRHYNEVRPLIVRNVSDATGQLDEGMRLRASQVHHHEAMKRTADELDFTYIAEWSGDIFNADGAIGGQIGSLDDVLKTWGF